MRDDIKIENEKNDNMKKNLSEDKKVNTQNSEDNIKIKDENLNKNNESEKQLINENEIVIKENTIKEISENKKEIVQNDEKKILKIILIMKIQLKKNIIIKI